MALADMFKVNVQPKTASTASSLQSAFSDYLGLTQQGIDSANQALEDKARSIAQLKSVSPETLQSALGSGNLMSASLGFNNVSDIRGMLPEEYQSMIAPRELPSQILQRNLKLADEVKGTPELRRNLMEAAIRGHSSTIANQDRAGGYAGSSQGRKEEQDFRAAENFRGDQFLADKFNKELTFRDKQHSEDIAERRADRALRSSEMVYRQKMDKALLDAARSGQAATMPIDDKITNDIVSLAAVTSPGYVTKDATTNKVSFNLQKLAKDVAKLPKDTTGSYKVPPQLKNAVTGLLQVSTQGRRLGDRLTITGLENAVGGHKVLYMGKDGLYGEITDTNGIILGYTDRPIVYYPGSAQTRRSSSGSAGEVEGYPKYKQ